MRNVSGNYWIPDDGYKYVTNGTVYSDGIYLGKTDNIANWHDTNDEPPDPTEEPTIEDKAEAYDILMGVEQ